jgi:phosphoglycolate phosphatase-like HAD superfamily hydrolase
LKDGDHLHADTIKPPLVVYVDVDDTLVRTTGTKRIPILGAVEHVRALAADGAQLFCWSSGGGKYARSVAEQLGIADCFTAFLPKPQVLLDDQSFAEWRRLISVHPMQCESESVATYRDMISTGNRPVR